MIRKSILTALVFLLAYHFVYPSIPQRFYRINGQQRQNHDRAHAFVFDSRKEKNVIIGSSMAMELRTRILGPDWRKLTFPGCSMLTAFEIMRKADKYPEVLLVETNQCFADANEDIVNDVTNPVMAPLRRHSRAFLEEGRPSNFVAGIAEAAVRNVCEIGAKLSGGEIAAQSSTGFAVPEAEVLEKVLKLTREQWDLPVDQGPLDARVRRIGEHMDDLASKGVICILFEMPVDSSLTNLRVPSAVRNAMRARFPEDRYRWLSFDPTRNHATRDGVHLCEEASAPLTEEIIRQVNGILSKEKSRGAGGKDHMSQSRGTGNVF